MKKDLINAVSGIKTPLAFLALVILCIEVIFLFMAKNATGTNLTILTSAIAILPFFVLLTFFILYRKQSGFIISKENKLNDDITLLPFQSKLVKQLQMEFEEGRSGVESLHYETKMNWERIFLKRVSALYENVKTAHAVTLSSISDFWVSGQDEELIQDYLECQVGKKIMRLFVFESPYDLKLFENILKLNFLAYGNSGGSVLVTSARYYQSKILQEIAPKKSKYLFLNLDFGFWKSEIEVFAELEGTELNFRKIDNYEDLRKEIYVDKFKSILENPTNEIFEWSEDCRAEEIAEKIFMEDVSHVGPVVHLVLLRHEDKKLLKEISTSVKRLDEIQREALLDNIPLNFCQNEPWWGINLSELKEVGAFTDGRWGGRLATSSEYAYILKIDLPSIDDLAEWYSWKPHSDIRREIYCKLIEQIKEVYEKLEKAEVKFDSAEDMIEKSGHLKRMDFIYNKKLEDIEPFMNYEKAKSNLEKIIEKNRYSQSV